MFIYFQEVMSHVHNDKLAPGFHSIETQQKKALSQISYKHIIGAM